MLRKLLRYEMQAMSRIMLPLYAVLIAMAALFGLMLRITDDDDGYFLFIHAGSAMRGISGTVYGVAISMVVIGTLILIIQRFRKNLLGNEGYLTLTLPVKTGTHISNKTISATLWVAIGTIAGIISILLLLLIIDPGSFAAGWKDFWKSFLQIEGTERVQIIVTVVEVIILGLVSFAESVVKIYAAIAVGHQGNNHRTLGSILAYIGFGIGETILTTVAMVLSLPDRFIKTFYRIAGGDDVYIGDMGLAESAPHTFAAFQFAIGVFAIIIIALMAIYWFITYKLMDRRLNLQ